MRLSYLMQQVALALGAVSVASAPLVLDAASTPTLNHYSDYGVVEQNQSVTSSGISISNDPYGYSAQYTDSESGLQYLQVRYYDPAMMRFTQLDTYALDHQGKAYDPSKDIPLLNRYAYAAENPIMDDDTSGHSPVGAGQSKTGTSLTGNTAANIATVTLGALSSVIAIMTGGAALAPLAAGLVPCMSIFMASTASIVGGALGATATTLTGEVDFNHNLSSEKAMQYAKLSKDFSISSAVLQIVGAVALPVASLSATTVGEKAAAEVSDTGNLYDKFYNGKWLGEAEIIYSSDHTPLYINRSMLMYTSLIGMNMLSSITSGVAFGDMNSIYNDKNINVLDASQTKQQGESGASQNVQNTSAVAVGDSEGAANQAPQVPFKNLIHRPSFTQQSA